MICNNNFDSLPFTLIYYSADQIRSFASDMMHNKNATFQYFSVDFADQVGSSSAVHANNIVAQALFLNEAIKQIQMLYVSAQHRKLVKQWKKLKESDISSLNTEYTPPMVTIMTHSASGIISRLALLLSNHPRRISYRMTMNEIHPMMYNDDLELQEGCVVSSIWMFNSPVVRLDYNMDVSLTQLYSFVNMHWLNSFYKMDGCGEKRSVGEYIGVELLTCHHCIPEIPIISITGGLLDPIVQPVHTYLGGITPSPPPALRSIHTATPVEDSDTRGNVMINVFISPHKFIYRILKGCFLPFWSLMRGVYTTTTGILGFGVTSNVTNTTNFTDPVVSTPPPIDQVPLQHEEVVQRRYYPAQYLTVHSSMLTAQTYNHHVDCNDYSVTNGIATDHTAVLWCFEILSRVHAGLQSLTEDRYKQVLDGTELQPLEYYLNIQWNRSINSNASKENNTHASRVHTYNTLLLQSIQLDVEYIQNVIDEVTSVPMLQRMYTLGVQYYTRNVWSNTLYMFVFIHYMVLITPLIRNICNIHTSGSVTRLVSPWVHMQLDIWAILITTYNGKHINYWYIYAFIGVIVCYIARILYMLLNSQGMELYTYEYVFRIGLSYGLAMMGYMVSQYAINWLRVGIRVFLVHPIQLLLHVFLLTPLGWCRSGFRMIVFATVWKVKRVRMFLKKLGMRRRPAAAPKRNTAKERKLKELERANQSSNNTSVFLSEEEEEEVASTNNNATDASNVSSSGNSNVNGYWVRVKSIVLSLWFWRVVFLYGIVLWGVMAGSAGSGLKSMHFHYQATAVTVWLSTLLYAHVLGLWCVYTRTITSHSNVVNSKLGAVGHWLINQQLSLYTSHTLVLYTLVAVLITPNYTQCLGLLFSHFTPIAKRGMMSSITVLLHTLLRSIIDVRNEALQLTALNIAYHGVYGPERVYDILCLLICNIHLVLCWCQYQEQ